MDIVYKIQQRAYNFCNLIAKALYLQKNAFLFVETS